MRAAGRGTALRHRRAGPRAPGHLGRRVRRRGRAADRSAPAGQALRPRHRRLAGPRGDGDHDPRGHSRGGQHLGHGRRPRPRAPPAHRGHRRARERRRVGRSRRGARRRARAASPLRPTRRASARAARAGRRRARGGPPAHPGPRPGRADTGVMSAVASGLSFEVLRFTVEPVSAEVALLELEGRFRAETRRRLGVPRLMAESDEGSREVAPAAANEAQAEPDGGLWRASYAVALDILDDGSFALAVGRELLVGLPAPDLAETSGEREVRLAREANALRRTADEARAAAAAALASAGTERQAREATEAEMAEARMARDDHARRAASLDDELAQLRREHAAELVRRDEERAAALAGRDEEAARAAEERVAELEAEAAEARRSLRAARAEAEAMRRDLERER